MDNTISSLRSICILLTILITAAPARADETAESAVWLLSKCTLVHRTGQHHVMLKALRQMDDPTLKPLFSYLVQRRHPVLRIHGILGLGEIAPDNTIDLALVADLKDARTQEELIHTATGSNLITVEQLKQLYTWPGLDDRVKVAVAAGMVGKKQPLPDTATIDAALRHEDPEVRGRAAIIKLELGDASAMKVLEAIALVDTPQRDLIRARLLDVANEYDFTTIAPWAMSIANEADAEKGLSMLALREAIRLKHPQGGPTLMQRFESTTSPADRIRLAMVALDQAPRLDPRVFDLLLQDDQPIVQMIGRAGQTIARGESATKPLLALVEENHVLASKWVLQHCKDLEIEAARPIYVGIILAAEGGENPDRFRRDRLHSALYATQKLAERDPTAERTLPAVMRQVPRTTQEAMLLGLLNTTDVPTPQRLIVGVEFESDRAQALALLLRIKHGAKLDAEQLQQLALLVRGGSLLEEPLRVQAAWLYLKATQQDKFAIAEILGQSETRRDD